MKIASAILIALIGVTCSLLVKKVRPELGLLIAAATGLILFGFCLDPLRELLRSIEDLTVEYGVETSYIGLAFKVIGITYLTQLGASICADAGESAVAGKVELCGRILILAAALPAALETLESAAKLIRSAAS